MIENQDVFGLSIAAQRDAMKNVPRQRHLSRHGHLARAEPMGRMPMPRPGGSNTKEGQHFLTKQSERRRQKGDKFEKAAQRNLPARLERSIREQQPRAAEAECQQRGALERATTHETRSTLVHSSTSTQPSSDPLSPN